jgi:hypothetical protein
MMIQTPRWAVLGAMERKWKYKEKTLDIEISLVGLKSKIKDHSVEDAGRKLQKTRRLIGKSESKIKKNCDKQGERKVKNDQK